MIKTTTKEKEEEHGREMNVRDFGSGSSMKRPRTAPNVLMKRKEQTDIGRQGGENQGAKDKAKMRN